MAGVRVFIARQAKPKQQHGTRQPRVVDEAALREAYASGKTFQELEREFHVGQLRIYGFVHGVQRRIVPKAKGRCSPIVDECAIRAEYLCGANSNRLARNYRIGTKRARQIIGVLLRRKEQ